MTITWNRRIVKYIILFVLLVVLGLSVLSVLVYRAYTTDLFFGERQPAGIFPTFLE